jgi:2-haloacid dehalogenase
MEKPKAFVFDAYGTLFDVHSSLVDLAAGITPHSRALTQLWRQKQLEYTWLRSLMGQYEDFWRVTNAALHFAVKSLGIAAGEKELDRLMQAYLSLPAFPDVKPAMERLSGAPLAILSNGSPEMLRAAVRSSGLEPYLEHVISVDVVRTYKPSPPVYALGQQTLKIPVSDMLFVSANAWDVAGAKAYGYQVCWCNRLDGTQEELGFASDFTVKQLDEIPERLSRL